jgi:hypothetical protein
MIITIQKPESINAQYLEVTTPVYTEDFEEAPADFPMIHEVNGELATLTFRIDIETKVVHFKRESVWEQSPDGLKFLIHSKVFDSGKYTLLDEGLNAIVEHEGYVPAFFPDKHFGDYLIIEIVNGKAESFKCSQKKLQKWVDDLTREGDSH